MAVRELASKQARNRGTTTDRDPACVCCALQTSGRGQVYPFHAAVGVPDVPSGGCAPLRGDGDSGGRGGERGVRSQLLAQWAWAGIGRAPRTPKPASPRRWDQHAAAYTSQNSWCPPVAPCATSPAAWDPKFEVARRQTMPASQRPSFQPAGCADSVPPRVAQVHPSRGRVRARAGRKQPQQLCKRGAGGESGAPLRGGCCVAGACVCTLMNCIWL